MSADNWTICPKCFKKLNDEWNEKTKKLQLQYGKISKEKYDKLSNEIKNGTPRVPETLREDYDIGIYKDKFIIKYIAQCTKCDFKFDYKYSEIIK
jgi:hypothetical protein